VVAQEVDHARLRIRLPRLSEDVRDRPADVGIVGDQREMPWLREQQGRADLEQGIRRHVEEELN
jgi:hypothetical protein